MTAGQRPEAASCGPGIGAAAPVDLDLAFAADPDLAPGLLQAAGTWLDPLEAEACWQALLAQWLAQLAAEVPPPLRAASYSAGLSLVDDTEIAALNADWRGKAGPTDVLAFAAQDEALDEAPPLPLPVWAAVGPIGHGGSELDGTKASDHAASDLDSCDHATCDHDNQHKMVHDVSDDGVDADADPDGAGEPLELGDIVISVETAARQAGEHGYSLARELLFLASHGLLHLLGWDHPDEASLAAMLARQEALLADVSQLSRPSG